VGVRGLCAVSNTVVIDAPFVGHTENVDGSEHIQYHQSAGRPWMGIQDHKILPFIESVSFEHVPGTETTL